MAMPGGRRRIIYGVHGYGRGHAARAQAVLPELMKRYDVRVLAGDDAYDQLAGDYDVVRIPVLRYYHGPDHRRSLWQTLRRNVPVLADLLSDGEACRTVCDEVRRFDPHVVISDTDAWTHRAAHWLGVPRISFDHYGAMAFYRLGLSPADAAEAALESVFYRMLVVRPHRIVAVAFYEGRPRLPGVCAAGPIIRAEARAIRPTDGDFLLAYFANADVHFTPAIEAALQEAGVPVRVYGPPREGRDGNVTFCKPGNVPFLRDLAGCRAVFATAGNQMISEAIHFAKPMLLMPEQSLEQRINGRFIQQWRAGLSVVPKQVTGQFLRDFLARHDEFAVNVRRHQRDGLSEALAAIDQAVAELTN